MTGMLGSSPLPAQGEVFIDARGEERTLRVSWHPEADTVVLSLWRAGVCAGTFRLPLDDVPDLVDVLRGGLRSGFGRHRAALRDDLTGELTG
jgi:hypothetical protein